MILYINDILRKKGLQSSNECCNQIFVKKLCVPVFMELHKPRTRSCVSDRVMDKVVCIIRDEAPQGVLWS